MNDAPEFRPTPKGQKRGGLENLHCTISGFSA